MLKNKIQNKVLRELAELGIAIAVAAVVFLLVYNFIARTGLVDGSSMQPTLYHGDLVFINMTAYWFGEPQMGDIVAFPDPENTDRYLIKRVIGVAGDEIDYADDNITVNGELLPPEYRMESGGGHSVELPLVVPEGTVFVLGDNRWASKDSRFAEVGCIPIESIVGRIPLRLFPFNRFGLLR